MALTVECSNCGRRSRVPESAAGRRGKCPGCGTVVDIPAAEEEAFKLDEEDAPIGYASPTFNDAVHVNAPAAVPPPVPASAVAPSAGPSAASRTPPREAGAKQSARGITATQGYIIIGLLLVGLGAPVFSFLRPTPRWEYKLESPSDSAFDDEIKKMGEEGWELVTARRATSSYGDPKYEMIFKRPR